MKLLPLFLSLVLAKGLLVSYPANLHSQICKAECNLPSKSSGIEACLGKCDKAYQKRKRECEAGFSPPVDTLPMCSPTGDRGNAMAPTAQQNRRLGECYAKCNPTEAIPCQLKCTWKMEKSMKNCRDNAAQFPPGVCQPGSGKRSRK
ncbi:hypothetical protein DSO57_1016805 [Entomophthora muscae]|uniref:Uncharacterized protein n=1 Tax=Entomophthora muscae TaxID=34485 RepID=A0ACC2STT2_9FUNG|nr:hypothetical protein DSO57_1016805 [Entomophthora muscae]